MKTIGMIGGMSWESTLEYYRIINEMIGERLGGLHSAKCLIDSVDFEEIKTLMDRNEWDKITEIMICSAQRLERAGADFIVICTNTIHKIANEIQSNIEIPLLHITDATAEAIKEHGIKKVGLLGTKPTMEEDFYKKRLLEKHGIETVIPNEDDRQFVHDVIFNELCLGKIKPFSKNKFLRIIEDLIEKGTEGIVLGCTELPALITKEDVDISLLDTTEIHAGIAVEFALTDLWEFIGQPDLYLETIDRRLFTQPYLFDSAIGKIFRIIPGGAGPDDGEITLEYVKSISPDLPEQSTYRLNVVNQIENKSGNLVITAVIQNKLIEIELINSC